MSPESGPQDTARGAIRTATADPNGGTQLARIQSRATRRHLIGHVFIWTVLLALVGVLADPQHGGHAANPPWLRLVGHTGAVFSVAFSPDGAVVASASADGTIRIWDVATGDVRRVLKCAGQRAVMVGYTPDGTVLVGTSFNWSYESSYHRYIQLWETRTWRPIRTLPGGVSLAVSPDGKLLATTQDLTHPLIKLWDLRTDRAIRTLVGQEGGGVHSIAFSPDGRLLVSGGDDSALRIWDVPSGTLRRIITRNDSGWMGSVSSVAWSPDGHTIASASGTAGTLHSDTHITLWDPTTGLVKGHLGTGDGQFIRIVAFSPDGRLVAGGTAKFIEVGVWDVQTGEQIRSYGGNRGFITSLAFSPDGRLLASASNDPVIWIWSLHP